MECRTGAGTPRHFGRHVDESAEAAPGQWTAYTLLIYLSGGLTGGETVFYGEACLSTIAVPSVQAAHLPVGRHLCVLW